MSDPPWYTACPNPFLADFVRFHGAPYDPSIQDNKEPFTADISEGKNDPIYNAHSYHTKVPHKAIMRYILHYTQPGDIIFDGFCGTGMTGVNTVPWNLLPSVILESYSIDWWHGLWGTMSPFRCQRRNSKLGLSSASWAAMEWSFSRIRSSIMIKSVRKTPHLRKWKCSSPTNVAQ